MSDLIQKLVEAKILDPEHGFDDEAAVFQTINAALLERQQLKQQLDSLKGSAGTTLAEPAPAKPAPAPTPAATQGSSATSIDSARVLRDKGLLEKDPTSGLWKPKDASFQSFADQLNAHDIKIQRQSERVNELLATDPEKFVEEFLSEAIEKRARQLVDPLQNQLSDFVRQPSAADIWYNENRERLEAENSPLAQHYNKIHGELSKEFAHLKEQLGDRGFEDYIHNMTGPRAELAASQASPETTQPAAGSGQTQVTQAPSSETTPETTTTDGRSLVDRVNAGDGAGASGERNNGSARLLNDHASQIGDVNAPITTQGRVSFMALAEQTASELGLNK